MTRQPSRWQCRERTTARRLAALVGFCLPLSGGLDLSLWIPGYPPQITIIRVVTAVALVWVVSHPSPTPLPRASLGMLVALTLVLMYGAISVLWAPDVGHAVHGLVTISMALATAVAVILLVRGDLAALRAFGLGVLASGAVQVLLALGEVATGWHLTASFAADLVEQRGLGNVEELLGKVAWGSLGNPNDLGGYLLLTTAVFLSMGAFRIAMQRPVLVLGWGLLVVSVIVGATAMADARAYRLGLVVILSMHLFDRALTPGRTKLRVPTVLLLGVAGTVGLIWLGGALIQGAATIGASDTLRLGLIAQGLLAAIVSGGFGGGLGAEQSLIETGEIPTNYHNVVVQLASELGLVVAGAFLVYLIALVISWAFVTRSAQKLGREASIARATLAVALLVYGVTSSGVVDSPIYWAFFAATASLSAVPDRQRALTRSDARRDKAMATRERLVAVPDE